MKFNWGVGIFIFLALFLTAAAIFVVFAFRQNIDLVHEDYYERGADYSRQMEIDKRSVAFEEKINMQFEGDYLLIGFKEEPGARVDSGNLKIYRPSDSKLDINLKIKESELSWRIPAGDLVPGRYIIDLTWFSQGLEYEVKKPLIVDY